MLHKPRPAPSSSTTLRRSGSSGCKQLERVAGWVGTGLYTAFFTSLDRCSCVKLDTIDMGAQESSLMRFQRRTEQPLLDIPSTPSPSSTKPRLRAITSSNKLPHHHHEESSSSPPCN
ncbi:hypothetical protein L7F22_059420 [Adiantum nelumboides]|nr:hypothetical protein [Adiantum nelumboides]